MRPKTRATTAWTPPSTLRSGTPRGWRRCRWRGQGGAGQRAVGGAATVCASAVPHAARFLCILISPLPACSWDDWKKQQDEAAAREAAMEAATRDADRELNEQRCCRLGRPQLAHVLRLISCMRSRLLLLAVQYKAEMEAERSRRLGLTKEGGVKKREGKEGKKEKKSKKRKHKSKDSKKKVGVGGWRGCRAGWISQLVLDRRGTHVLSCCMVPGAALPLPTPPLLPFCALLKHKKSSKDKRSKKKKRRHSSSSSSSSSSDSDSGSSSSDQADYGGMGSPVRLSKFLNA